MFISVFFLYPRCYSRFVASGLLRPLSCTYLVIFTLLDRPYYTYLLPYTLRRISCACFFNLCALFGEIFFGTEGSIFGKQL